MVYRSWSSNEMYRCYSGITNSTIRYCLIKFVIKQKNSEVLATAHDVFKGITHSTKRLTIMHFWMISLFHHYPILNEPRFSDHELWSLCSSDMSECMMPFDTSWAVWVLASQRHHKGITISLSLSLWCLLIRRELSGCVMPFNTSWAESDTSLLQRHHKGITLSLSLSLSLSLALSLSHTHTHTQLYDTSENHAFFNDTIAATGWRRLIGSLIFISHFQRKSPIFKGSFVENDLQRRGS